MGEEGEFGDFKLDIRARLLLHSGKEIPVQPRVFDLLSYLYLHRDRIIPKEELLDAIWPDVVVTDASLQRAISIIRGILRKGGFEGVIRNYARQGYRFCEEAVFSREEKDAILGSVSALEQAHAFLESSQWSKAAGCFAAADEGQSLSAIDFECWAHSLQCAGKLIESRDPLERAAEAWSAEGELESVARVSITLARVELEATRSGIAAGWLSQAREILQKLPFCDQHGHLAWMQARLAAFNGDYNEVIRKSREAIEVGDKLDLPALQAMGLLYLGIAYQAQGEISKGIQLQDEAAARVIAGQTPPLLGGIIYCGLVAGCTNCADWPRATQWTESFNRWCRRKGIHTFAGSCILYRAKVSMARGDLEEARREISDSEDILLSSAPWAVGDAYRLIGDIHLLRGEHDLAETQYRRAHDNGWDPNPGYACLLHERNQSDAAIRSLQRALATNNWSTGERRVIYLSALLEIASQAGLLELANSTRNVLLPLVEGSNIGGLPALVKQAVGELFLAEGRTEEAIASFREALSIWLKMECIVNIAKTRVRLAHALKRDGDVVAAELECSAAIPLLQKLQAVPYLEAVYRLGSLPKKT